jgi:argininosuccinate lyase
MQLCEERGCELPALTLDDLKGMHPLFEIDVMKIWDFEASVERRDTVGGTSMRSVLVQAKELAAIAKA